MSGFNKHYMGSRPNSTCSGRAATEDQLKAVDDQVAANKDNITKNAGDIKTNKDNIDKNTTAIARKISLGGDTGSTDEKSFEHRRCKIQY